MSASDSIEALVKEADQAILSADSLNALEDVRIRYLGKKGAITSQMQKLSAMNDDERRHFGQSINKVKTDITDAIEAKKEHLKSEEIGKRLATETVDITLPVRPENIGGIHPISQVIEEAIAILSAQGFSVAEGPDIEDDFHNFTALNIPEHHPARQMQDTFYLQGTAGNAPMVLRTHTSPVQIRTMEKGKPPFKIIAPGRVYRSDSDMTHTPMFHQIEGLYIDKGIHMGHLKGCIIGFLKAFFELDHVPVRFRPSFFPFTEPSAEVDIGCSHSKGELTIGAGDKWLEILGCGMVHPNVLKNVGIDPEEYQGFAFGLGIERMAMLKYGIPDLRTFFDADARWLSHYNFAALDIPSLAGGLSR
ncbi:MAG: phenylalanine--tRNA ligase subunit alpha [Rickettsiales bacterium]|jgi:phenylalanyl-tRNA synthetase alpha chain|nr:phenylalanine--tRNA ligase subunit alpha [Rickettsiales bacterium]